MYVIVDIQGQQFKVEAGKKLFVHRLAADQGAAVEFDKVLLIDNDGDVKVGTPLVEGAKVVCEVLSHLKGERIIVFKKKRRKGYRKRNGHRQALRKWHIRKVSVVQRTAVNQKVND